MGSCHPDTERSEVEGSGPSHPVDCRKGEAQREMRMARESGAYDHFLINGRLEDVIEQAHQVVMQRKQPSSR